VDLHALMAIEIEDKHELEVMSTGIVSRHCRELGVREDGPASMPRASVGSV
jgi:hypothetical protein